MFRIHRESPLRLSAMWVARKPPGRTLLGVLTAATIGLIQSNGVATSKIDRVVIVSMEDCCPDEAWPEVEETLKSELRLENIPATFWSSLAKNKTERLDEMRRAAESRDAAAVIRVTKIAALSRVTVDLWVVDSASGRSTYRQLNMRTPADPADTLDVAVRTVEALRASLLELKLTEEPKPFAPAIRDEKITFPRFGAGAAGGLESSPGGLGVRGGFAFSLIAEPIRGLDIEANAFISPFGQTLETKTATSTLDYIMTRGFVYYRFDTPILLEPALGIGAGSLMLWGEGRTLDGESLKSARLVVPILGGGVRLFARVNKILYVVLGTSAMVTFPEVRAVHGKKSVAARFGRPVMDGQLGIQLRFPE